MKISITRRYLSTNFWVCKTIYLFDLQFQNRKIMVKMPEIVGLGLVAIMTLAFVGTFQPQVENGLSPVFWVCAGGALGIIFYRKWKGKQEEKEN
jgi:FtsH-binding integral membrane protein